ncbi:MAG: type II secretion system F family protein [Chloroflexota bacterium]
METIPLALSVVAATSVLLLVSGASLARGGKVTMRTRLDQFAARSRTLEEIELSQPFFDRVIRPTLNQVSTLMERRRPDETLQQVRRKLTIAGAPNNMEPADFLSLKALVAGLLALVMLGLLLQVMPWWQAAIGGGVLAAIGYFLPDLWLATLIGKRKKVILKALPDALDLLTISVEAGLGFDAALNKVAQKWDNALSDEFNRTLAEMRVGKSRREALRDLCARTDVPDMNAAFAAVIQSDQLGVSIAQVLRVQSEQMRVIRRQRAEEEAHQAPVKMTFPLIFLIFPAMLIVILGPAVLQIAQAFSAAN